MECTEYSRPAFVIEGLCRDKMGSTGSQILVREGFCRICDLQGSGEFFGETPSVQTRTCTVWVARKRRHLFVLHFKNLSVAWRCLLGMGKILIEGLRNVTIKY